MIRICPSIYHRSSGISLLSRQFPSRRIDNWTWTFVVSGKSFSMCTRRIVLISLCNCIGRCEYFGRHKSWSCMLNAIVEGMRKASMRRCKFSVALCAEKWMHFLWMRRRELNDIYNISYAYVCFSELIRHSPKYVSLSLKLFPLYLIWRRSIMRIYLHREPVISLRRCSWFFPWAPFISSLRYLWRCIAEGNASRRVAFANCNLRNINANVHVQRQSVMKVSIKCRWRDFWVAKEKRVVAKILFYAVTTAFSGFWRDECIIARRRRQKPVIYKGHKGEISRRNWKRGLFLTEGHFHPRDMSLKTISNFVACGKCSVRYVCTKHRAYGKKKDIRAVYCGYDCDESVRGNMCRLLFRSQSHTHA